MQTLEEQFNTRVNAFLDSTGMSLPPAHLLSGRVVRWVEAEVEGWIRERLEGCRGGPADRHRLAYGAALGGDVTDERPPTYGRT